MHPFVRQVRYERHPRPFLRCRYPLQPLQHLDSHLYLQEGHFLHWTNTCPTWNTGNVIVSLPTNLYFSLRVSSLRIDPSFRTYLVETVPKFLEHGIYFVNRLQGLFGNMPISSFFCFNFFFLFSIYFQLTIMKVNATIKIPISQQQQFIKNESVK